MSSSVTSCQLLVPGKSGVEEQNNQDVGGDDPVTKENVSCVSVKAYLPNFFASDLLSRLWKVVSLLLNFLLIVVSFYWSYMLFQAINCEDEDVECYEDTAWVVHWTNWLFEAVMPDEESPELL